MKPKGPELEWWVEVWGKRFDGADGWTFHSIHQSRDAARGCAAKEFKHRGGRWRVLDVAKWPIEVLGA